MVGCCMLVLQETRHACSRHSSVFNKQGRFSQLPLTSPCFTVSHCVLCCRATQAGAGSATLSMAWAAARFAESCLRALSGEGGIVECSFVASGMTSLPFFARCV